MFKNKWKEKYKELIREVKERDEEFTIPYNKDELSSIVCDLIGIDTFFEYANTNKNFLAFTNPRGTFIIGDDFWVQLDDPSDEWQFLDPVILKFTREQVELLDELIGRKL